MEIPLRRLQARALRPTLVQMPRSPLRVAPILRLSLHCKYLPLFSSQKGIEVISSQKDLGEKARWIPRGIDPFTDLRTAFEIGMAIDDLLELEYKDYKEGDDQVAKLAGTYGLSVYLPLFLSLLALHHCSYLSPSFPFLSISCIRSRDEVLRHEKTYRALLSFMPGLRRRMLDLIDAGDIAPVWGLLTQVRCSSFSLSPSLYLHICTCYTHIALWKVHICSL